MAVKTGRYGAVEVALPKAVFDDDSRTFSSAWAGPLGTAYKDKDKTITTELPKSGTQLEGSQIDIKVPTGFSLEGPKIVSSITSWSLDNTITPIEYTASNTHGYRGKLAGLHDATGNIAGLGAIPPLAPGQRFRFYGYTGPDNGMVDDEKGIVYAISAIVNSVQIQVSYQWNSPITWTVGWQADWHDDGDELTVTDGRGFWDYTKVPCCELMPSKTKNLDIYSADGTTLLTEDGLCLLDANIQFTNETAQYANSCSASAGGWQSRIAGPTTCSVSTNIQGDDFRKTGSLLPGSDHRVMIYVGDEDCGSISCWDFNALFFSGFSGLNVDVTNNSPLQFSCNMDFNAFPKVDGVCTPGWIKFCRDWHENASNDWDTLVDMTGSTSSSSESLGG